MNSSSSVWARARSGISIAISTPLSTAPSTRCAVPLSSRHEITVEWGDCDPAGIVYYPAYFRWIDQATYRLFLAAGLKRDDITSGQWKEGTPLVHAECSFKRASQT